MNLSHEAHLLPGARLDPAKMPGHWLLARMGKRVLRPGGLELTKRMLDGLAIGAEDAVVEFAPGLGATARLTLERRPASYTGIERDEAAMETVSRLLRRPSERCLKGTADNTGLESASASVVYGEAMLTMHGEAQKAAIVREAFRVLAPGGRYGIHELGLAPDTIDDVLKAEIVRDLSRTIHIGARPLTISEWRSVLESAGFEIESEATAPMRLLELSRLVRDEGVVGALRICGNIAKDPVARRRVLEMRGSFRKHMSSLCAVALVARKPRVPRD